MLIQPSTGNFMKVILPLVLGGLVAVVEFESSAGACNLAVNDTATSFRATAPSTQAVTGTFGTRKHPILGIQRLHPGIDFDAPVGDPVKAAATGQIVEARRAGEFGNRVDIDHGGGYATSYSHMSRFAGPLEPGDCVEAGTVIGFVGATGLIATPHLHFEITRHGVWLDPQTFIP